MNSIPFLVHQIWIQGGRETMPTHIRQLTEWVQQSVETRGGMYRLWSEADLVIPEQLSTIYHSCPSMAAKSDILRMLLIYQYGGMYLDTDMILTQPDQLEWLISSSGGVQLAMPYLWDPNDDKFCGINTVSILPYNNCVVASPAQSNIVLKILQTIEKSPPFRKDQDSPFQWTLNTTGPVMIEQVIKNEAQLRMIPRTLIVQSQVVKPSQIGEEGLAKTIRKLRLQNPTAVLVHGQDRSWFPSYWMFDICDCLLRMSIFFHKHSSFTAFVALFLLFVCIFLSVLLLRKRR